MKMRKKINYLFDVDGTLTPSRGTMLGEFKQFFVDWVAKYDSILVESTEKGKFGRILGTLYDPEQKECFNELIIEAYHAVPYTGQSKADIREAHMANRKRLTDSGFTV